MICEYLQLIKTPGRAIRHVLIDPIKKSNILNIINIIVFKLLMIKVVFLFMMFLVKSMSHQASTSDYDIPAYYGHFSLEYF